MIHQDAGLLRSAMDGVRDLVVMCDPHGSITLVNRAMEIFTGIESGEILPEQWSAYGEMLHPGGEPFSPGTDPMSRSAAWRDRGRRDDRVHGGVGPATQYDG